MNRDQVQGEMNAARRSPGRDDEQSPETVGGLSDATNGRAGVMGPEGTEDTEVWMRTSVRIVSAAVAAISLGCSPQRSAVAVAISDKVHAVAPDSVKVDAGIMTGSIPGS